MMGFASKTFVCQLLSLYSFIRDNVRPPIPRRWDILNPQPLMAGKLFPCLCVPFINYGKKCTTAFVLV